MAASLVAQENLVAEPEAQWQGFAGRRFFGSLDGLRGLSILAVIWHHTARSQFAADSLLSKGALGVDLFFAISGFLITTLLLRERKRFGHISLKLFYLRRTLRIFPLYYTVLTIYVILTAVLEQHSAAGRQFWSNLPYYLTYTSNWFVHLGDERVIFYFAWSLATEEQFYLFWPSVERWLRGYRPVLVMVGVIALVQAARAGLLSAIFPTGSLYSTIVTSIAPPICLGVLLAHLLDSKRGYSAFCRLGGWRWSSAVALVGLVSWIAWAGSSPWELFVLHALMVLLVGTCVVREDHFLAGLLGGLPLRPIGTVSYGMYLYHMLTIGTMRKILHSVSIDSVHVAFVASTAAVFAVAWLSYHYYEMIFLRWKDRFREITVQPKHGPRTRQNVPAHVSNS